jgi:hypothetical protein
LVAKCVMTENFDHQACNDRKLQLPHAWWPKFFYRHFFGVSHYGLAIYTKKYLKVKEELWKFQYFTMQKYNLQKKSSKKNQTFSRYHNSIINPKFQHKPKYHLSKIIILYNESKHNILTLVSNVGKRMKTKTKTYKLNVLYLH